MAQAHPLVTAVTPLIEAMGGKFISPRRMEPTDIPLRWDGEVVGAVRLPALHGALDRLIAQVERELGTPVAELDREQKQQAVALLDDLGAFTLRKGVEDVADALGVSRFTVYNYLHAVGRGAG